MAVGQLWGAGRGCASSLACSHPCGTRVTTEPARPALPKSGVRCHSQTSNQFFQRPRNQTSQLYFGCFCISFRPPCPPITQKTTERENIFRDVGVANNTSISSCNVGNQG